MKLFWDVYACVFVLSTHPPCSPLQPPILLYSAHNPYQFYAASLIEGHEVHSSYELQYLQSATLVVQPQLLDNILSAVGIEQLIYLYAKVRVGGGAGLGDEVGLGGGGAGFG